ncbi:MAG: CDP-alcohol phosphatidyltransferase family protein [Gammaproteobacteria bacterium]
MLRASHIPNLICVLRIILVAPIVANLLSGDFAVALLLIIIAGFSDGLDGFLAKRFDWRTRLGGLLDPVADKLLMLAVFVTLTFIGLAPVWLTAVVIGRDVIIVSGAVAYTLLIGPVRPDPSLISKLNTACQLLFMFAVIAEQSFDWLLTTPTLMAGAGVLFTSIVSGLDYVLRWSAKAIAERAARSSVPLR